MPIRPKQPVAPLHNPTSIVARPRTRAGIAADPHSPAERRAHHLVDRSSPNWDADGNYIVGKGRPPMATRWQKGQSGNPRGPKPAEKLDPQTAFYREALGPVTARVNGEEVQLEAYKFLLQSIRSGVAQGKLGQIRLMAQIIGEAFRHEAGQQGGEEQVEAWERQLIDDILSEQGLPPQPIYRAPREIAGEDPE